MAGSLVLLESETASSSASVTLGTTNWDSSFDVYMVVIDKMLPASDAVEPRMRFTKTTDNSVDDSSNYDYAWEGLYAASTYYHADEANDDHIQLGANLGTGGSECLNSIIYLFDFNGSSDYSFFTVEGVQLANVQDLWGAQGGGVLTVAQATNGVQIYLSSGNIASGEFRLYGLKK
tara:strand:- start:24 stop:551 length:528 start_codon:yes stop_codon:yes gene_type:complete